MQVSFMELSLDFEPHAGRPLPPTPQSRFMGPTRKRPGGPAGSHTPLGRGSLKRSPRAVQLFGRLAVLETHTLRY